MQGRAGILLERCFEIAMARKMKAKIMRWMVYQRQPCCGSAAFDIMLDEHDTNSQTRLNLCRTG
jgi:hypothetical protein